MPSNTNVTNLDYGIHYTPSILTSNISGVPTELEGKSHAIAVFVWGYSGSGKSQALLDMEGGGLWTRYTNTVSWVKC